MWNFVSSAGKTVYRAAAKTGLAAGTEQPPYPCALPLMVLEDGNDNIRAQEMLDTIFSACKDMLENDAVHQWSLVDYQDPDRLGDLHLFTRSHIGPFNFAKATMSFMNVTPQQVLDTMHSERGEDRQKYSANLTSFDILARPTPTSTIQLHRFWAPPPVAGREFLFLSDKKYAAEEDTYYVFGCSVDYAPHAAKKSSHVRASCCWAWELTPVGNNTLATYVSCMNLRGWTPTFIVGWLKTEIAKELVACRRVVYGETVKLDKYNVDGTDLTPDEINRCRAEEEKEEEKEKENEEEIINRAAAMEEEIQEETLMA